ncbi:MAG: MASE1 domain-containing protein [Planctomycetota bacterium]
MREPLPGSAGGLWLANKPWLLLLCFIPLHLVAVRLGYAFYVTRESVSVLWPASGVMLAVLFLMPWRFWPLVLGVGLGCEFAVARAIDNSGGPVGFADIASQIEALVGASLLRWFVGRQIDSSRFRDTLALAVFGAVLAPAVAAFLGVWTFVRIHESVDFLAAWQVWVFSDGIGVLAVVPVIFSWLAPRRERPRTRIVESIAVIAILVVVTHLVFRSPPAPVTSVLDLPFVLFPLLLWAALRLEVRAVSIALLLMTLIVVHHAAQLRGPFVLAGSESVQAGVLVVQTFLATVVFSILLLHAAIEDRRRGSNQQAMLQAQMANMQRLETVGRLGAGVAHDLNNQLTLIMGWTHLLQTGGRDEETRQAAEQIGSATESCAELAARLRNIGRQHTTARFVPVADVLQPLLRCARPVVGNGVSLEGRVSTTRSVFVDPIGLEQAVLNLIVNAGDAQTNTGTIRVVAEDSTQEGVEGVMVRVHDSGVGMTDEVQQRAFDNFYTTKGQSGTGLGLGQVRDLAEAAGGWVSIESKIGVGTTVTMFLPRWSKDSAERSVKEASSPAPTEPTPVDELSH